MKTVILKTRSKPQNTHPKTPSPYDPQHPYKEPQSGPKDITVKDIENDLIENDPSKGFETDMDTPCNIFFKVLLQYQKLIYSKKKLCRKIYY